MGQDIHHGMSEADIKKRMATLALGAVGVVYGDIGTSPLYTLQTTLSHDGMHPTPESIYGVLSLSVTSRWREFGMRAALGADSGRMLRLVVGEAFALVGVGAAIGIAGAIIATRVLSAFLFGVSRSDPTTYVLVALVLGGAAFIASWLPARRAAAIDPVEALRAD